MWVVIFRFVGKLITHVKTHNKPPDVGGQSRTCSDDQKRENIEIKENPVPLRTVRDAILVPATGTQPHCGSRRSRARTANTHVNAHIKRNAKTKPLDRNHPLSKAFADQF